MSGPGRLDRPLGAVEQGAVEAGAAEAARVGRVTTIPGGGSWLRIALALATLATLAVIWVPGQAEGQAVLELAVMAAVFLWLVARPGSAAAVVLMFGALCLRVSLGKPELDGSLVALTVLLPLVHQLAAVCVVVPLRANVQWPALLPTAVRYIGVVTATVLGLLLSSLLGWW